MAHYLFSKSSQVWSKIIKASFLLLCLVTAESAYAQATLSKVFSPNNVGPGNVSTLTFTISNSSASPITGISYTSALPTVPGPMVIASPANIVSSCDAGPSGTLVANAGSSTISVTDYRLGAASGCSIKVDVTASTPGTHFISPVTVSSSAGSSMSLTSNLTVATTRPAFTMSFSPSTIPFGARSTLTYNIDNSLNASRVGNLDFTNTFPAGMIVADPANASSDCVSMTAPDTTITAVPGSSTVILNADGNTIFAGFEVLPAGGTCTMSVDVTASGVGQLDSVTSDLLSDFVSSGKASASLNVTRTELSIRQSFLNDPVVPGDSAILEFTIDNFNRNFSATGVGFTNDLTTISPAILGLTYDSLISNSCGGSVSGVGGSTITLGGGTIAPQGSCAIQVSLALPAATTPGVYTNTTTAVSGTIDGTPVIGNIASDTLNAEPVPILTVEYLESGTLNPDPVVNAGENVVLRYTITNPSTTSAATDVTFLDELTQDASLNGFLPFPISVVSPSLPSVECGGGNVSISFIDTDRQGILLTGGSIAASGSCSFDVQVTVPEDISAGTKTNTTGAPSATIDGATRVGLPASDTLSLVAAPLLTKSFTDSPVAPGGTVTLEYTLSHSGNSPTDATSISFTDDLSAFTPTLTGITANLPASPDPQCGVGSSLTGSAGDTLLTFTGGTLAPGASCTFSVTVSVPLAAATGSFTNVSSNVTATVASRAVQAPSAPSTLDIGGMLFSTEFLTNPVLPGEALTLRYNVENISSGTATNFAFSNSLFSVASLEATDPVLSDTCGGTPTIITIPGFGSQISYNGGMLAAGLSCQIDVEVTVPLTAGDGTFQNLITALNYEIDATTTGSIGPAIDDLVVQNDDRVSLTKEFSNTPVIAGDSALVTYEVSNPDTDKTATAINFTDNLGGVITGLQLSGLDSPSDCVTTGGAVLSGFNTSTFSVSSLMLAPGASCTITATVDVPITAATGQYTSSTSAMTASLGGFVVTGSAASDDIDVVNLDIDFTKSFGTSSLVAGGTTTIDYAITNNDASGLIRLSFTDDLDGVASGLVATNLPLSNVCGTGSSLTGTSTLSLLSGSLGAGETCMFSVQVAVPSSTVPGLLTSTTSELAENSLNVEAGATASITITPILPVFSKVFSPDAISVGGTSTLQFTINNNSSAVAATSLDFTDNLPAGLTVATTPNVSTTCTGGTITAVAGSSTISYTGGSVSATSTCTLSVDITANTAATFTNVSGDLTSSSGNSGTANDTVQAKAASFSKSFGTSNPQPGGSTSLSFTVTNSSASDILNGLAFTDDLNSVLSGLVVSSTLPVSNVCGSGSTLSGSSILSLTGGSLAAGASCTFSVTLAVPSNATAGDYVNITSTLTSTSLTVANTATDTLTIAPTPETPPTLTKTFTPSTVETNQISLLRFSIDNSASMSSAGSLNFTDSFPSGLVVSPSPGVMSTCTGGTVTASPGTSLVSYTNGTVSSQATCSITVNVQAAQSGVYANTTGILTSSLGNSNAATATLTVEDPVVDNDRDSDGIPNDLDNCPDNANSDQADLDSDGLGNACDNDSDNDQMPDDYERANGLDPFNSFDQQSDPDGDGFSNLEEFRFGSDPNVADTDENNNGIPDSVELRRMRTVVPNIILPLLLDDD